MVDMVSTYVVMTVWLNASKRNGICYTREWRV